jgi:hypothetical protein
VTRFYPLILALRQLPSLARSRRASLPTIFVSDQMPVVGSEPKLACSGNAHQPCRRHSVPATGEGSVCAPSHLSVSSWPLVVFRGLRSKRFLLLRIWTLWTSRMSR